VVSSGNFNMKRLAMEKSLPPSEALRVGGLTVPNQEPAPENHP